MPQEPLVPTKKWWICAIIGLLLFLIVPLLELFINFFPKEDSSIITIYSVSLIILTFFLVIVTGVLARIAYMQLPQINNTAKADFLLRIDDRYGSEPIIKARQIIHRLYLEAKTSEPTCKDACDKILAGKIKGLHADKKHHEDFIHVLNFLDFLETVAYFSNQQHVSTTEINELLGGSLVYSHKIFTLLISHLRSEYQDNPASPSYYSELDKLVLNIQTEDKSKKT